MSKLTTTRHDFRQDAALDFFICGGRQRSMQDSETHHEPIPLAGVVRESEAQPPINDFFSSKHPHDTKRSRQAVGVATRVNMEHHGWKHTGTKSSLWAFEHRWAHRRDHAEGRNHRLPGVRGQPESLTS
jgi:hypothetical protein